jgi:hypothetical protein
VPLRLIHYSTADLVDVANIDRRDVVAGAEHAIGGGQGDQHGSDRRSVVAAHHQDGGEIVADVRRVGQGHAIGFGGVAAERERRPIVDGEKGSRPTGQFLPHGVVHRFDQGRLLDAWVDTKPPEFLGEGSRLEPRHRGSRPRRGVRSSFSEALDE